MTHDYTPLWGSDCDVVSAAMDHVRLSYGYLDDGDLDAYCSLFAEQAVVRQPGASPVSGRDELEKVERARRAARSVRHSISAVFGSGHRVVAIGRLSGDHGAEMDFVDVFTVADNGLLIERTTFLFTPEAQAHNRAQDMDQPGADVV
jgi:ketosteroid isomerase-like protein